MKTFIATLALTLSLGALANANNTMTPGYTDATASEQQRMEETKTKTRNHADGTIDSVEKTTTKETPMMDSQMEKDSTTTQKTRKVR